MNSKLIWYTSRLSKMSPHEIWWRLKQRRKIKRYQKDFSKKTVLISEPIYQKFINSHLEKFSPKDIKIIELPIKHGSVEIPMYIFCQTKVKMSDKGIPMWHVSYYKKQTWDKNFSLKMDIKQRDDIGDPRIAWETNRLQFLLLLSLEPQKNKNMIQNIIQNWIEDNPFMQGINWISPMESALRNISIVLLLSTSIVKEYSEDFLDELKIMVLNQYYYIHQNYSSYSSANNHLLIELIANNMVEILFNMNEKAITIERLNSELIRQTYEDGVNKEQAVHYHLFVLEALLVWKLFCKQYSEPIPKSIDDIILKMLNYIVDISNDNGFVNENGDSDEGSIINFNVSKERHNLNVISLGTHLFCDNFNGPVNNQRVIRKIDYLQGGKSIFKGYIKDKKVNLLFEYGDLGMPSLYAHGHADCLSINLSVDSIPVIVDGGTYIYNIEYSKRNILRLPQSHSTLYIEGDDFSIPKGAFLWADSYKVKEKKYKDNGIESIVETVNGNTLSRSILYKDNCFFIEDTANKEFITQFILNPELVTVINDNYIDIFFKEKFLLKIIVDSKKIKIEEKEISTDFNSLCITKVIIIKIAKHENIIFKFE